MRTFTKEGMVDFKRYLMKIVNCHICTYEYRYGRKCADTEAFTGADMDKEAWGPCLIAKLSSLGKLGYAKTNIGNSLSCLRGKKKGDKLLRSRAHEFQVCRECFAFLMLSGMIDLISNKYLPFHEGTIPLVITVMYRNLWLL